MLIRRRFQISIMIITLVIIFSSLAFAERKSTDEFDYKAFKESGKSTYLESLEKEEEKATEGALEGALKDFSREEEKKIQETSEEPLLDAEAVKPEALKKLEAESDVSQADQERYDYLIRHLPSKKTPEQ